MPPETKVLYEFGKFRCDPQEHLLLSEGRPVALSPKAFEILLALIQSKGRLLTKDALMHQVWPDSFVEEGNLTVNISALRRALGENSGEQQYIETVPRRGYRFVAPVTERHEDEGKTDPALDTEPTKPASGVVSTRPPLARGLWWTAGGLLLIAAMVVILISSRSAKLTDKDTVVLADFANTTADPVFDGALRQGLSSQLEQSPFLHLLSDERVAQTLPLMAQPKDSRLTHDLARQVCQRTASSAVLDGTIAQVGTQYLLTLKAINCANGESLGSTEAEATDKNHVLAALGKVASEMRNQLGESLTSVQAYDAPPENVTTPSLEALKAYSLGYQAMVLKSDYDSAVPLFQQAISLDPNFAMAYARMGTSYFNLNETGRATDSLRRAYELRENLSEREKLYIAAHYELVVTGNLDAARKVFELLAQTYPRDAPYTNLGIIYSQLGDYDRAIVAFEQAVRMAPPTGNRYANLVNGYLQLKRIDEALTTVREAQSNHIDSPEIHVNLYWAAFLQNDAAAMRRESTGVENKPGYEDQMLNYESDTALYAGQLDKSRALARRAIEAARKGDEKEAAAIYQAQAAVREALVGNLDPAKQQAQSALAASDGKDVEALSAIALGIAGDSKQAKHLADDLEKRYPDDTIVQYTYLPTIKAASFLHGRRSGTAPDALAAGTPYELGGNLLTLNFILYPVYVRGEAYLAAKKGPEAAAEFEKILDHPGAVRSEPIGALAHLQLGRAYILTGDQGKAVSAYKDFLALWKDANPDIPILKEAKAEYAKLQ
jgi:DNA-binding winged helix-turn-helix (wHTH) protein/tetratricopeptide (TPR) repeat protein